MLQQIIFRLFRRRHFWREVGFDELSEIYVTCMFRSLSLGLISTFAPLYLLRLGYPASDFLLLIAIYFGARGFVFDWLSGFYIARFGAKHAIATGYTLLIASTAMFLTLPAAHWPLLLLGLVWGASTSFYAIPFHVDFSKIKHRMHGGKELGYVTIMNKVGSVLGPLIGGVVATLFGGQYIFLVSAVLLLIGGVELLRTPEAVHARQRLRLRDLQFKSIRREVFSLAAFGVEQTVSGSMWPLYLSVFVFTSGAAYAKLGSITSASVLASVLAAYSIGRLVDNHRGRSLLRIGAITNAVMHLFRPFIATYPSALLLNISDEAPTVSYQLPYTKGLYDLADEMDSRRIVLFTKLEGLASIGKCVVWSLFFVLAISSDIRTVTTVGFIIGAITSLLIMTERFKALDSA